MTIAKHVFLIGFMGCGKSFWGMRLATELQCPFVDLDGVICEMVGLSIPEIFAQHGESGFRKLERDALRQFSPGSPAVIATGGGTPCFFDNLDWMNQHGTSIYLQVSAEKLAQRLQNDAATRPLLSNINPLDLQAFITSKLEERAPFYLQASAILTDDQGDYARTLSQLISLITANPPG